MNHTISVSVVICTWNRADLLDRTLRGFHELRIPKGVSWELIVVNNNCTDNTDEVLSRHGDALPIRRLFEPEPGLSRARNLAVAHAAGELLIWTDDDVLVDPEWLAEYVDAARQWPDAIYFGGTVDPWFSTDPPDWVLANLDLLNGPFAIRQLGDDVRPLDADETVFGASMAFRREAFAKETFDTSLGRVQGKLISGEDMAIVERLKQQNSLGVWVGRARVRHFIPASRLTRHYVWAWCVGAAASEVRAAGRPEGITWFGVPRYLLRSGVCAVPGALVFSLTSSPRHFASYRTLAASLGTLREVARGRSAGASSETLPAGCRRGDVACSPRTQQTNVPVAAAEQP